MAQPQVIFLDAVGTLFGVKGSVGKVYSEIAQQFGVEVADSTLNKAFFQSFKVAPPPIFPGIKLEKISESEFNWWYAIALGTFQQAGVIEQFSDFATFFAQLYSHFTTAEPWFVYPDVRPALEFWQKQGIQLGIISNFDSRLYSVLKALDLAQFFTSITICTEVGAAKPSRQIFLAALNKYGCTPNSGWHIGDSYQEDYQGAKAVGLRAILIERH